MRNIQIILELWGAWSRYRMEMDFSPVAAGFKGLLPEAKSRLICTDDDAMKIDCCVSKLKMKRPDEYNIIFEHYVKNIPKRQLAKNKKCDEKLIRIQLKLAEGFIEGCLSALDINLECDNN